MKDFSDTVIFCKCSGRMHCKGKHFKHYEFSPLRRKCPNCGKKRRVMEAV